MIETHEVSIQEAENSDIPGIITCMQANLMDTIDDKRQGRLFYNISPSEFASCLDNPNSIFVCARQWNDVLGYVLTYDLSYWIQKNPRRLESIHVSQDMKEKLRNEKILYWYQVAIRPDHQRNGISKSLEMKVYTESIKQGYTYTVAEIMKEPRENRDSMSVHQKVWFEKIGEITYDNGTTWNIMGRSLVV